MKERQLFVIFPSFSAMATRLPGGEGGWIGIRRAGPLEGALAIMSGRTRFAFSSCDLRSRGP